MPKVIDLTNKKFGKLLVLNRHKENTKHGSSRWECVCDCNTKKIKIFIGNNLLSGSTISCGCEKEIYNLIGKKFGKLTVLNRSNKKGNRGEVYWKCICDCENKTEIETLGHSLRHGLSKSCGCRIGKNLKYSDREDALWKKIYSNVIISPCLSGKRETDIDIETLKILVTKPCYYCGKEYSRIQLDLAKDKTLISDTQIKYNGLDRIDSSKDYFKDNIRPCCGNDNNGKMDLSSDEYDQQIINNYNYRNLHLKDPNFKQKCIDFLQNNS